MAEPVVSGREYPLRWNVGEYFGLVTSGVLRPDDRVELLEGIIVAMSPQNPRHAATTSQVVEALRAVIGGQATFRVQMPLVLGRRSAPEPDVAVVPGRA